MSREISNDMHHTMDELLLEITNLKTQLEYERNKHRQWKSLATSFHDTIWELIEKFAI